MIRTLARPAVRATQRRFASTTTTTSESVPLANLELRWKTLSAQEQGSLTKQLESAQAGDWAKMTLEQKKAGNALTFFFPLSFFSPLLFFDWEKQLPNACSFHPTCFLLTDKKVIADRKSRTT